jgi:hypothetical protein
MLSEERTGQVEEKRASDYDVFDMDDMYGDVIRIRRRKAIFTFMRWNGVYIGADAFRLFSEELRKYGVAVEEVSETQLIAIKGEGLLGYATRGERMWTELRYETLKWLRDKCNESTESARAVHDILWKHLGDLVTCDKIDEYINRFNEDYRVTLSAILESTDSDMRLYKVLLRYLGQPSLIRPY